MNICQFIRFPLLFDSSDLLFPCNNCVCSITLSLPFFILIFIFFHHSLESFACFSFCSLTICRLSNQLFNFIEHLFLLCVFIVNVNLMFVIYEYKNIILMNNMGCVVLLLCVRLLNMLFYQFFIYTFL